MNHITSHELDYAIKAESPNRGGIIYPRFVVMHYTASFDVLSAVSTLTNPNSRVSAHVTIDKNGMVYQHVPFNVKAWHAGPSSYAGYSGLNDHSIGIEIVNPGWFRRSTDGTFYRDGTLVSKSRLGPMIEAPNSRVGSGLLYWPEYTAAQLEAVEDLTKYLIDAYDILDIVSHEEIDTRGWKTDPGPAFPMLRYKKILPDRILDSEKFAVNAHTLNVRGGPGTNFSVLYKLRKDDRVRAIEKDGAWVRISADGWVHGAYIRLT